jgi:hypothetical protein
MWPASCAHSAHTTELCKSGDTMPPLPSGRKVRAARDSSARWLRASPQACGCRRGQHLVGERVEEALRVSESHKLWSYPTYSLRPSRVVAQSRQNVRRTVLLECAGNGRSALHPRTPRIATPWFNQAFGVFEYMGTPLAGLLAEAVGSSPVPPASPARRGAGTAPSSGSKSARTTATRGLMRRSARPSRRSLGRPGHSIGTPSAAATSSPCAPPTPGATSSPATPSGTF